MIDIKVEEVKHRVISQDYIILGKQAKDSEVKIHFDSGDPVASKHRIENGIRLTAYAYHLYTGGEKGSDEAWIDKSEGTHAKDS